MKHISQAYSLLHTSQASSSLFSSALIRVLLLVLCLLDRLVWYPSLPYGLRITFGSLCLACAFRFRSESIGSRDNSIYVLAKRSSLFPHLIRCLAVSCLVLLCDDPGTGLCRFSLIDPFQRDGCCVLPEEPVGSDHSLKHWTAQVGLSGSLLSLCSLLSHRCL